ncbi:signal peptidase I [Simkania sp.]|uniref:signal peptidase I n=1 Tax=Simkania sp. TaxID=34094 RepID=UPI003B5260AC
MRTYSLYKSKKILLAAFHQLQKAKKAYSSDRRKSVLSKLKSLQDEILRGDRAAASKLAKEVEALSHRPRTLSLIKNFVLSLCIALAVAGVVRQMWFELYEIPTGSMRPTFKEKDRLIVSKSKLGINIPFLTKHLYFNPDLCKRMSAIVFTSKNMDVADNDTMYFYLFPGKKQFIKRLIGKPGDTLYFYGGLIYGIDKDGKDISPELQQEKFASIEHTPFIRFEGRWKQKGRSTVTMDQMGFPLVEFTPTMFNTYSGKTINSGILHEEAENADFRDLLGIKNYVMVRLLSFDEMPSRLHHQLDPDCLYLQIQHPPNLKSARSYVDKSGKQYPLISYDLSYIPIRKELQEKLSQSLYTARFIVQDGYIFRYGSSIQRQLKLEGIPNGTYEFYNGVAYQIDWTGTARKLSRSHPLYKCALEKIQFFFNQGIDFFPYFSSPSNQNHFPSRYAYFREGSLYLMGAPILGPEDPALINFVAVENQKAAAQSGYYPFVDYHPPLKEGNLDIKVIKQFGLKVPEGHYLVLGDNHAMSADSRDFGFVPEKNIKGTPSFIFWPFGDRFGFPSQVVIPFFTFSNVIIWALGILFIFLSTIYSRRKNKFPIDFSAFQLD